MVPTRSDVSAEIFYHCEQDAIPAWMKVWKSFIIVSRKCSRLDRSMEIFHHCEQDVIPTWMKVRSSFITVSRMCSRLDGSEYYAFLTSRSDISVETFSQMIVMSCHTVECECWAFLM